MSDTLSLLLDKQRITEILSVFCRGVDRRDTALIRSVFCDSAVVDYGTIFHGGVDEFVDFMSETHAVIESQDHYIGNVIIQMGNDVAASECYVMARVRTLAQNGAAYDTTSYGRYIDRWSRSQGGWRIEHRRYVHSIDDTRTAGSEVLPMQATRDHNDPSYEILTIE